MNEEINILCTIDKNYVQHCGVMLTSLLLNNPNEKFNVFLFTDYLPENDYKDLLELVESYGSQLIKKEVDINILRDFPVCDSKDTQYSIAVYYRLLMAELLPETVKKIIYLDCDLVIRGCIKDLWNINIEDYALAAIDDAAFTVEHSCKRLQIAPSLYYFNAGVLLVNLEYWRKQDVFNKAFDFILKNRDILLLQDQDVLNVMFCRSRMKLPIKWNMLECFYTTENSLSSSQKVEMLQYGESPLIIHWATNFKPWMYGSHNMFKKDYYKYLQQTKWRDYKPSKKEIFRKFGKMEAIAICLKANPYMRKIFLLKSFFRRYFSFILIMFFFH